MQFIPRREQLRYAELSSRDIEHGATSFDAKLIERTFLTKFSMNSELSGEKVTWKNFKSV